MRIALRGVSLVAVLGIVVLGSAGRASADPISTLYGTGLNTSGGFLANGAVDPHYTVSPGGGPFTIGNPAGVGWVGNTSGSQWISPAANTIAEVAPERSARNAVPVDNQNAGSVSDRTFAQRRKRRAS